MRLCAVSVDLDEIPCYAAIHGLPATTPLAYDAVYRRALPRFEHLFDELGLCATFFAIGSDLNHAHAASLLKGLAQRGHEIGNHTQDHLYDLTRRSRAEMRAQVAEAAHHIERVTGVAPVGFRAPGYTINDQLFEVLVELGVAYDSSVFPCPAYYLAKCAAIASYRLRRRPTHSVVDTPRVLGAPAEPYRIGVPYTKRGSGLLELPIGVTRDVSGRLPYIGTFVMAHDYAARLLTELIAGRELVNLELHGIDAADAELDGLQALRPHQPDLQRTAAAKLESLRTAIQALRAQGYEFVTLAEAARRFASRLHATQDETAQPV
jgi:peptidoglycan/xylan/chitin deacetylase (PgdA/CDA1 family)